MRDLQMEIPTGMCNERARSNGHKLKYGRLWLYSRGEKAPVAMFKPWNRLPREATRFPVLKTFKSQLGTALNNLI